MQMSFINKFLFDDIFIVNISPKLYYMHLLPTLPEN